MRSHSLDRQDFIGRANLEVGTPRERVNSIIDSHELPAEQSVLDITSKKPNSRNPEKGKGNSSRKESLLASGRGRKSQAKRPPIPSETNPSVCPPTLLDLFVRVESNK